MNNRTNLLQQRWMMRTNPFAMKVPPMCRLTTLDILQHLRLIKPLPELGDEEVGQCLLRFEETFGERYGD